MTGTMHARELLSLSTHIYFIARVIYSALKNETDTVELLASTNLYFVPIVNVDTLAYISEEFRKTKKIPLARKNRHAYEQKSCMSMDDIGVDLSRNFGFRYGQEGSSSDPCDEEFRGSGAFSEPESQAIKRFVDTHRNVKASVDYHTYGNVYILPSPVKVSEMNGTIYEEFYRESGMQDSHKIGSVEDLLSYTVSGDASDWMYGEKNLLALTIEVGSEPEFVPTNPLRAIKDIKYILSNA
eukprot:TRINITY_DN5095_c0_g4_i2.p1 TRINITY_DN5095_c0_g4~~TRINITY_DN5095_c0_g4_i2.p1  ORF type:complete len:240 (+),score=44.06 TRINITY_DN5095_c0_g4_i2:526-1245(+)